MLDLTTLRDIARRLRQRVATGEPPLGQGRCGATTGACGLWGACPPRRSHRGSRPPRRCNLGAATGAYGRQGVTVGDRGCWAMVAGPRGFQGAVTGARSLLGTAARAPGLGGTSAHGRQGSIAGAIGYRHREGTKEERKSHRGD